MTTTTNSNPLHPVRAYTEGNPVRLASVLVSLAAARRPGQQITRQQCAVLWAQWWPGHKAFTGNKTVRARIRRALAYLRDAGIVRIDGLDNIVIVDAGLLTMAASNLTIVTSADGEKAAGVWSKDPAVPDALRPLVSGIRTARAALAAQARNPRQNLT